MPTRKQTQLEQRREKARIRKEMREIEGRTREKSEMWWEMFLANIGAMTIEDRLTIALIDEAAMFADHTLELFEARWSHHIVPPEG